MDLKTRDNCMINYQVQGSGFPLIFIHGWAASQNFWKFQVEYFKEQYKVILFDLRGHGNSCKNAKLSVNSFVNDLEDLVNLLKLNSFVLIGHSLGTMISMIYAHKHPDKVKGLVLIGAFSKIDTSLKARVERAVLKFLIRHAQERAAQMTKKILFHPDTPEEIIEFVMQESSKTPVDKVIECMEAIEKTDITRIVPNISTPVLLLYGEAEKTISKSIRDYLASNLNVKKVVYIPKAGHNAMLENPSRVNKEIEDFLNLTDNSEK